MRIILPLQDIPKAEWLLEEQQKNTLCLHWHEIFQSHLNAE